MNNKTLEGISDLWIQLVSVPQEFKNVLKDRLDITLETILDIHNDGTYLSIPLKVMFRDEEDKIKRCSILIILSEEKLITLQSNENFGPFKLAQQRIKRYTGADQNPRSLLRFLLHLLNEEANRVIVLIGSSLESKSIRITKIANEISKQATAMADFNKTMQELNNKEEQISRCLENQLSLAQAARYLDAEVYGSANADLQSLINTLREDINGVKEHMAFEHNKVSYMQRSIIASLDVQQNKIVKIFTIITVIFLPPTLVASIYGMNFTHMPELQWAHGFTAAIALSVASAVLPLLYIKLKGWLS